MSSVRKETERTKFIQDKCQTLLTQMLRDEDNKYCVDCDAKGPRWASWNLGVFLCIRCAGIHRNLGVHISRVRSVNLDSWTPEQVMSLQNMGNSRARAIYEAQLPDGFRRPQTDSALESFVRAKYEHKKYLAREYVPTAPAVANWDKEIDEEMERQKRSKKKTTGSLGASISTLPTEKKSLSVKSPNPITLTKPTQSPKSTRIISQPPPVTSASADLLGLCSSPAPNTASITNGTKSEAEEAIGDIFSSFISGPTPMTAGSTTSSIPLTNTASSDAKKTSELGGMSLAKQEEDFFNQVAPTEQEKGKMTRDSIMALYAKTPSNNTYTDAFNNGAGAGFKQFNGVQSGPNAFHQAQSLQQQQQQPSQMVGFSGIPASNQFSNAQLLSQLGGVGTSSMPGAVFGINPMNGNQSNQQQPPPQMFANFGSTPQQAQHQLPSFAQFPPMSGASANTFPNAATASNGFGSNTMRAAQQPGLNAEFANLNMWQ